MKKFFLSIATALMLGGVANAQSTIVSSTGVNVISQESSTPSTTEWILRAGFNFAGETGADLNEEWDSGIKLGYDVAVSFQKPLSDFGMFWGMELGLGTRGFKFTTNDNYDDEDYSEESIMAHNLRLSPFTFGYAYQINETMKIDAHFGAWASYDLWGNYNEKFVCVHGDGTEEESWGLGDIEGYNKFDAGITLGIGFWFDRYNLDFSWQRGFVEMVDGTDMNSNNLMLRLGIAF